MQRRQLINSNEFRKLCKCFFISTESQLLKDKPATGSLTKDDLRLKVMIEERVFSTRYNSKCYLEFR